jgi:serine/threonine protein kinase
VEQAAQAQRAPATDRLNLVLGGTYRLDEVLGEGGMATVYRASNLADGRPYAVKVLEPRGSDDALARRRFTREAINAMRIAHPHAVRTLSVGEGQAFAWLVMEYVAGVTLQAHVERSGCCDPATVAAWITQLASVLDHVHTLGIVHRDVKPANVMLVANTEAPSLRLLDFGLARDFALDSQAITMQGTAAGTPGFIAPEQRAGLAPDHRADVFSLAAVAAYLLAGRLPVAAWALPLRPEMFGRRRRWSDPIDTVLAHGLAIDPAHRPASAGAFAVAFSAAVQGA